MLPPMSHDEMPTVQTDGRMSALDARSTVDDAKGQDLQIVSDVVEKNMDSSSKSNPLRRRRENYDASTWRRRRRRRKKIKSTNF